MATEHANVAVIIEDQGPAGAYDRHQAPLFPLRLETNEAVARVALCTIVRSLKRYETSLTRDEQTEWNREGSQPQKRIVASSVRAASATLHKKKYDRQLVVRDNVLIDDEAFAYMESWTAINLANRQRNDPATFRRLDVVTSHWLPSLWWPTITKTWYASWLPILLLLFQLFRLGGRFRWHQPAKVSRFLPHALEWRERLDLIGDPRFRTTGESCDESLRWLDHGLAVHTDRNWLEVYGHLYVRSEWGFWTWICLALFAVVCVLPPTVFLFGVVGQDWARTVAGLVWLWQLVRTHAQVRGLVRSQKMAAFVAMCYPIMAPAFAAYALGFALHETLYVGSGEAHPWSMALFSAGQG